MKIPHTHHYSHHANKTLYWIDSDSEEIFQRHMQDYACRAQLEKYGWDRPGVITYKFNSHGFRCREFDDSMGIITLGCSLTAGVGLPLHSVWNSIVAQTLELSLWNLGIGGASMDTCYRLLYLWIHRIKAEYVLLLTPPVQRFELHTPTTVHCFHPQTIIHPIQRWWYEMPSNGELNFEKNLMGIRELCRQHNKKLIFKSHDRDLFGVIPRDQWPPARDLLHVGVEKHRDLAKNFLDEISIQTDQASP